MGLKILHSADWHLDSPFASLSPEQRTMLRRAQLELPGKISALCRREHCDLMLLAGDLFDGPWTRDSADALKQALADCGVPVFISPGNHDYVGPDSPWVRETWPENVYIFRGDLESVAVPELQCRVYGAGFTSMDSPSLLEGFQAEGSERWCVAVLHGDPAVTTSPCNPVTAAQVRGSGLDYLALGHIHRAGAFRAGSTLCGWPGCPMGRGWDETGEKGVYLVNIEETADIQRISLNLPCFYQQEVDVGEDPLEALEAVLPGAGSEDFYRITLTGRGNPDLDGLYSALGRFPNLELRDRTRAPMDLWADVGEDSLRGRYFRILQQASENPETREQAILAAEISRMLLEGREVTLP